MYSLIQNISEQRLFNIKAAASEIEVRLRDFLRNGLFRLVDNILDNTEQLRRRLIDNQAPGLAAMFTSLANIDFSSVYWKQQLVSSISRIFTISQAVKNIESLPADWQNEILALTGVSFPQQEVAKSDPVSDIWLALAVRKEVFNSMTMVNTWYFGKTSRRFACNVEFVAGNHIVTSVTPGAYYESRFHYFPGIHSMRVVSQSHVRINTSFAPQAFNGLKNALRICRRAFSDNPFMTDIPLIMSGLRLARRDGALYLADSDNLVFPIRISDDCGVMLLSYTGGRPFSAFVVFHDYFCEIISIWADGKYYVLNDDID